MDTKQKLIAKNTIDPVNCIYLEPTEKHHNKMKINKRWASLKHATFDARKKKKTPYIQHTRIHLLSVVPVCSNSMYTDSPS